MSYRTVRTNDWFALILILYLVVLIVILLSGCTRANQQLGEADSTATSQSTEFASTNTPESQDTNTANNKGVFDTRVAQFDATIAAQVTLSPKPPYTPFAFQTQSPQPPTPTWAVGYFPGPRPPNTINPEYLTCWYGTLNDKLLRLCAGHEQQGGDPEQGVLQVKVIEQDQVTVISDDVYETPEKVGVVHIVTADSNSVTVASEDGQHTFTFDIATRRWVSPPVPTSTASP